MPPTRTTLENVRGYDPSQPERLLRLLTDAVDADLAADAVVDRERKGEVFALKYAALSEAVLEFPGNFIIGFRRKTYRVVSIVGFPNPRYGHPRYLMHVPLQAVLPDTEFADLGRALEHSAIPDLSVRLAQPYDLQAWPGDRGPHPRQRHPRLAPHQRGRRHVVHRGLAPSRI